MGNEGMERQKAAASARRSVTHAKSVASVVAFSLACGCQQQLMPTPTLYAERHDDAFDHVPAVYRNNQVDVLYVTDRNPLAESRSGATYGYDRSPSMAFGSSVVEIGRKVTWDVLARESQSSSRKVPLPLSVTKTREAARFPDVPYRVVQPGPPPVEDPTVVAADAKIEAQLHEALAGRLAGSDRKQAYVFIHGFDNTFEDAVMTTAELWHFLGRQGVPVCYTWPAGRGMSGRGYVYDRTSGDFTVFHLKRFLRALSRCKELEKVHILAHSRGTMVITNALRELNIECKCKGQSAREVLKLGNLVLAAPDIDFDVAQQRIAGEHLGYMPQRMTIYTSPNDRALELADLMTLGLLRLGQIQPSELTPRLRQMIETSPTTFVEALVHSGDIGHSYFVDSPAVSSDIILLMRDDRAPGGNNGRPLKERMTNFWEIRDDYLRSN